MKFSERKGFSIQAKGIIQTNSISDPLRNSLWNVLYKNYFSHPRFRSGGRSDEPWIYAYVEYLYSNLYKLPIDRILGTSYDRLFDEIRRRYFECEWFGVYDFLETTIEHLGSPARLEALLNEVLERELAGYRLISGRFVDVTDPQEVRALDEALSDDTYLGVQAHLRSALEHLSRRENPDYRNSIKESISAVEALARIVSKNPRATLGDALKAMEASKRLHPALKDGFSKLYGYTSDQGGIRHAMLEEPDISAADAKYMLLACTSFINYLKALT